MSILFDLQNGNDFTDAEYSIAEYILSHSEQIADMSIADLAKETHTSNASVIRLCRKVGSKGFRDFRLSFLRELSKIPDDSAIADLDYPIYDRSSPVNVMKSIADVQKFAINTCFTGISALDIQKAAFLIHSSRHVYLYGMGESMLVAQMFSRRLTRIGYISLLVQPDSEHIATTKTAEEGDVAIMISYSGSGLQTYEEDFALFAKKNMRTVLITSNQRIRSFDCSIFYPAGENSEENAATFYSTEASMYITNCIYSLLFAMDYQDVKEDKTNTDKLLRRRKKNKWTESSNK